MGDASSEAGRDLGVASDTSGLEEVGVAGGGLVTLIRGAFL